MIVAVTGHRLDKLGGYNHEVQHNLLEFAKIVLPLLKPTKIISGMALGWDQAVAEAAIELGISFVAAVPFVGQESIWPLESQTKYNMLIEHASEIRIISDGGYAAYKMQVRNKWMVDNSERLFALWDGSSGGTANCVRYAEQKMKPITNVWPAWREWII